MSISKKETDFGNQLRIEGFLPDSAGPHDATLPLAALYLYDPRWAGVAMSQHPILTRFSTSLPEGQRVSVRTASQLFILLAAMIEHWLPLTLGPARPTIGPFPPKLSEPSFVVWANATSGSSSITSSSAQPVLFQRADLAVLSSGLKAIDGWSWAARGIPRGWPMPKFREPNRSIRTFCRSSRLTGGHVAQPRATALFLTARACGPWSTCCC
jgi:hypothetical protein